MDLANMTKAFNPSVAGSGPPLDGCGRLEENQYLNIMQQQQQQCTMYTPTSFSAVVSMEAAPGCHPAVAVDASGCPARGVLAEAVGYGSGIPSVHSGVPQFPSRNPGYPSRPHGWPSAAPSYSSVPPRFSSRYQEHLSGTMGYSTSSKLPNDVLKPTSGNIESHEFSVRTVVDVQCENPTKSSQPGINNEFWKAPMSQNNSCMQSNQVEYFTSQNKMNEYSTNTPPSYCFPKQTVSSPQPTYTQHWHPSPPSSFSPYNQQHLASTSCCSLHFQHQSPQRPPPVVPPPPPPNASMQSISQTNPSHFQQQHSVEPPPSHSAEFQKQSLKQQSHSSHFQQQQQVAVARSSNPSQLEQHSLDHQPSYMPQYHQLPPFDKTYQPSTYQQPHFASQLQAIQTKQYTEKYLYPSPIVEKPRNQPPPHPSHHDKELVSPQTEHLSHAKLIKSKFLTQEDKAVIHFHNEDERKRKILAHMKWMEFHRQRILSERKCLMQKKLMRPKQVSGNKPSNQEDVDEVQILYNSIQTSENSDKVQRSSNIEDAQSCRTKIHPLKYQQSGAQENQHENDHHLGLNSKTKQGDELNKETPGTRKEMEQYFPSKQTSAGNNASQSSGTAVDKQKTRSVVQSQPYDGGLDHRNHKNGQLQEFIERLPNKPQQQINQQPDTHSPEVSQTKLNGEAQQLGKEQSISGNTQEEMLNIKYNRHRGKFARMLGSDSPPPAIKKPRYSSACMRETSSSSVDINLILETSLDSFVTRKTVITQNPCDCLNSTPNVSSNSDDILYGGSIKPVPDSRSSNTNSSPESSNLVRDSSSSIGREHTCTPHNITHEYTSTNIESNHRETVRIKDKQNISATSCNLTPPPTPPTCILSPEISKVSETPVTTLSKSLLPKSHEPGFTEELDDSKPVTFTSSFLEAPTVSNDPAVNIQPRDNSVISVQPELTAAISKTLHDLPVFTVGPSSLPSISSTPKFRIVHCSYSADSSNSVDASLYTETSRLLLTKTPNVTASHSLPDPSTQTSTPTIPTESNKTALKREKQRKQYLKGISKYQFNLNLCIKARFSIYIPSQSEFPCIMCGINVAGEDALYHLFFGQVECLDCGFRIDSCKTFKSLKPIGIIPSGPSQETCGENHSLQWSSNPVDFLSYHMTKIVALQDCVHTKEDNSPSITSVVDEMGKFLDNFSVLKLYSPWREAIYQCRKYVMNMKSSSDLTPRNRKKRRHSAASNSDHVIDSSCSSKEGSPAATNEQSMGIDLDDVNNKISSPQNKEANSESKLGKKEKIPTATDIVKQEYLIEDPDDTGVVTEEAVVTEVASEDGKLTAEENYPELSSDESVKFPSLPSTMGFDATSEDMSDTATENPSNCSDAPSSEKTNHSPLHEDDRDNPARPAKESKKNYQFDESQSFPSDSEGFHTEQDSYQQPLSQEYVMSPELDSGFGDLILSQSYTNDMLEGIIQYVSIRDENANSENTWMDSPFHQLHDDSRVLLSMASESLKIPSSPPQEMQPKDFSASPLVVNPAGETVLVPPSEIPSHSTHKRQIYKPMPRSKRTLLPQSNSGNVSEELPPVEGPPLPSLVLLISSAVRHDIHPGNEKYMTYSSPSQQPPEECPMCYLSICPTKFVINVETLTITYRCGGCGLFIYITQEVEKMHSYKKPGPRSKTMKWLFQE